jgi:hypothetical protein
MIQFFWLVGIAKFDISSFLHSIVEDRSFLIYNSGSYKWTHLVAFEILTSGFLSINLSWNMMLYHWKCSWHFEGTWCLHLQGSSSVISQKTWKCPLPKIYPHKKIQVMKCWAIQQINFQFQEPPVPAAVTTNTANSTTDTHIEQAPWYKLAIAALKKLLAVFGNSELRKRLLICHFAWCVTAMTYYALALNADNFTADR